MDDLDPLELVTLGVSALGDAGAALVSPDVRATWPGARVAGPAVTVVAAAGDNLAVQVAVAGAPPGAVIVVDASAAPEHGYWGEVLVVGAVSRGVAGLVISGGVRDTESYARRGFPVFATTISARATLKHGGGSVGDTIVLGGASVSPGDWVIGDADGVAVIAPARLAEVAAGARAKADKEGGWFRRLEAGETTLDLYGLDASLVQRGGR